VLVTGCSSGIGAATARMLRARGWNVLPTARAPADLDALRANGFSPVPLDVADPESVRRCAQKTLELSGGRLGAVVNNAGFGQAGAVEDLSRDVLRRQFEVNLIGMQDLTNRLIPTFRQQGWGRIVNISSVLGRVSLPFYGSYSATKFAMEALADAMRVELHGTGIGVILIEPGPIISEFRHNAAARAQESLDLDRARHGAYYRHEIQRRIRQQKKPDAFTRPPEAVAEKIVHALESPNPKRRYCVTIPAYLGAFMSRFAPDGLLDWAMVRKLRNR
jgi:NAD(P)-dependent dehydrogenase (short-subunit alcohol dehydrogenase family)